MENPDAIIRTPSFCLRNYGIGSKSIQNDPRSYDMHTPSFEAVVRHQRVRILRVITVITCVKHPLTHLNFLRENPSLLYTETEPSSTLFMFKILVWPQ